MLLLLELNEVNFDYIQYYAERGALPNFQSLLKRYGRAETISEKNYDELEPWIQWVTVHTGLTLAEHGIHRLGDVVESDIDQVWEILAREGLTVGAVSPMNAKCRDDLAFFIPDPWTTTGVIATPIVKRLYSAIKQAVNDNAKSHISLNSLIHLAAGVASAVKPRKYLRYLRLIAGVSRRPWLKSVVLDNLLADLFIKLVKENRADFASLFLNAAAHVQHHYLFSSAAYEGEMRNPDGYVCVGADPLLDVYTAYDIIIGDVMRSFPEARLMLATALHQDPHPSLTYYWRLRDHAAYLDKLGIDFVSVEPRMSRDFLINFADTEAAATAKTILGSAKTAASVELFEIADQGKSLFVMLCYPHQIDKGFVYSVGGRSFDDFETDVVFVALKNGQHNGTGYFIDTGAPGQLDNAPFPLKDIRTRILAACSAA